MARHKPTTYPTEISSRHSRTYLKCKSVTTWLLSTLTRSELFTGSIGRNCHGFRYVITTRSRHSLNRYSAGSKDYSTAQKRIGYPCSSRRFAYLSSLSEPQIAVVVTLTIASSDSMILGSGTCRFGHPLCRANRELSWFTSTRVRALRA